MCWSSLRIGGRSSGMTLLMTTVSFFAAAAGGGGLAIQGSSVKVELWKLKTPGQPSVSLVSIGPAEREAQMSQKMQRYTRKKATHDRST